MDLQRRRNIDLPVIREVKISRNLRKPKVLNVTLTILFTDVGSVQKTFEDALTVQSGLGSAPVQF